MRKQVLIGYRAFRETLIYISVNDHIQCLDSNQNRFLRFISYKSNVLRESHQQYKPFFNTLNMNILEVRRKYKGFNIPIQINN